MLGWHIRIYKKPKKGMPPPTSRLKPGTILADWHANLNGLEWIYALVEKGKAIDLSGNGYPHMFTAMAKYLIPPITNGPPGIKRPFKIIIDDRWIVDCPSNEWLVIEVWDES